MNHPAGAFPATALTRRQFGLLLGGGSALLAGGGMYGVIASSEGAGGGLAFGTRFGQVVVRRAGRFARLDALGRAASSNLALASAHLNGIGGGNVQRASARTALRLSASHGHDHHGGTGNPSSPQPLNFTWGEVVVLEVEIQNHGGDPVLFSPGQLRLVLGRSDVTVTPQDSNRSPGAVAALKNEHVLITYLAPHDEKNLEVEFVEPGVRKPLRSPLPLPEALEVLS